MRSLLRASAHRTKSADDILGEGDGHGPRLVRRYKRTATNVSANSLAIRLRHERA
jgi:hypothetical protein